jgi:oligopeptidase B
MHALGCPRKKKGRWETMRHIGWRLLLFVALAALVAPSAAWDESLPQPPVAKKVEKIDVVHGDRRVDNYYWLREKSNPEVRQYLEAENAYTEAVMKRTIKLQAKLNREILDRIEQTDASVPYRLGDFWYYHREEKGKQYSIHCRKKGAIDKPEEIILDENQLAEGHKYLGVDILQVSDDGNLLAFSIDTTGLRQYALRFKDLGTGKLLPDEIHKVASAVWAADNKTVFYVTEDAANRPHRLYRHVLGESQDHLVYEEKDALFELGVSRTRDKAYLLLVSESKTTTEFRYLPSDRLAGPWRIVLPREEGHEYYVSHHSGLFYIRTNKDALNFRLVTAPVESPGPEHWKEVIPHRPDVLLEEIGLFVNHCVIAEHAEALPRLRVLDLRTNEEQAIDFPEPVYAVAGDANPEFNTTVFRFRYESMTTPDCVYDYDMDTRERKLQKQTKVLGGYDPAKYTTERIWATAKDGVRVPVSLVHRKGIAKDGSNPLLLYGYGAYGFSYPLAFASERVSLLDRGVIYAYAHVRGGNDMGRNWYDDGKMLHKCNTFTDFIAVAEHLIEAKYTSRDHLAIQGGSAGGLLIGAVLNMRPDLFKAAVLEVPFVDAVNTMLDDSLPLTSQEFLEWGNPKVKREYDYIKSYCPYTNIAAANYPSILVMTSLNDSQVMYWEPAKYVAKLRATKTDKNPLLLKTNMNAGHGGASGRYDSLEETAFTYAFLLWQLGIGS